jgi:hypothetical protein
MELVTLLAVVLLLCVAIIFSPLGLGGGRIGQIPCASASPSRRANRGAQSGLRGPESHHRQQGRDSGYVR